MYSSAGKNFACEVDILEASDGNDQARRAWLENWLKKIAALSSTADIDISGRALSADEEELQARIELVQHQEILAFWKLRPHHGLRFRLA